MQNHKDRQPGEQQPAAPPVELQRFKLRQNRWGKSEEDTETIDSVAVDRSEGEQI